MICYIDINKIFVSNKVSLGKKGFKCFIGYTDGYIMLPKMNACRRDFNETKYISFLIKNDKLLEKFKKNWDKVSNAIKKGYDSEPIYNKKYLRTKVKSY